MIAMILDTKAKEDIDTACHESQRLFGGSLGPSEIKGVWIIFERETEDIIEKTIQQLGINLHVPEAEEQKIKDFWQKQYEKIKNEVTQTMR